MKGLLRFFAALCTILVAGTAFAVGVPGISEPLMAGTDYTITLQKLTSAGALETLETTTGTTDGEGTLSFTLTQVPTKDQANFIFVTITDNNGLVVRKGVAPAPPPDDNNATGLNYLSTKQADALIRAAEITGSDDPIVAAYLFIILRSPDVSAADIENIAHLCNDALTDPDNGFESYLLSKGITAGQLGDLKGCLIYNPDNNAKTLRDFTRNFFNAVATDNADTASSEMQKAGGFMAEVFLDAGTCAGIDAGMILAAHNAAGDGANAGSRMDLLPFNVKAAIETAMTTFNRRISIVRISSEYTNALNTLGASGVQVTQYLTGVNALMQSSSEVDQEFAGYYMDRDAYLAANPGANDNTVQEAINNAYSAGWEQFQLDIAADNVTIDAMKDQLLAANPSLVLPPDFGTYYDQNGTTKNWPVPQVVLVNWLAGSSFEYNVRDNTAIPGMMSGWMGSCDPPEMGWDMATCQGSGGTWIPGRHTYDTGSGVFNAYLSLQEDLNIIQMKRNEIWNGPEPTGAERAANEDAYMTSALAARDRITGSRAGAAITAAEKDAIVKLLLPPQM